MTDIPLIVIVGPTASGKTTLAVELSETLGGEVVSADSAQVRQGMRIGTALPSTYERRDIPHHLMEVVDPDQEWTLVDWISRATTRIEDIWTRRKVPILVGGTGQYVWSLLEGRQSPRVPPDQIYREQLQSLLARGDVDLHQMLKDRDPKSAERIHPNNHSRIIRALEIVESTGLPVPPKATIKPNYQEFIIGLQWSRKDIYRRADMRVEYMFANGLISEVKSLVEQFGSSAEGFRAIGYREAIAVLNGEITESQAIDTVKTSTHRLIRSQAGWFRANDPRIHWIDVTDDNQSSLSSTCLDLIYKSELGETVT